MSVSAMWCDVVRRSSVCTSNNTNAMSTTHSNDLALDLGDVSYTGSLRCHEKVACARACACVHVTVTVCLHYSWALLPCKCIHVARNAPYCCRNLSVYPCGKRVICDKTKAPSDKKCKYEVDNELSNEPNMNSNVGPHNGKNEPKLHWFQFCTRYPDFSFAWITQSWRHLI